MIDTKMNEICNKVSGAHLFKVSDTEYKVEFTGALFQALDKLVIVERNVKSSLNDDYDIKIIEGEGLDVTFKFTKKQKGDIMKESNTKLIDGVNGIMEVEIESMEDIEKLMEYVKIFYPYAVIDRAHYYSKTCILNLYKQWGEFVTIEMAKDGDTTTCIHCGRCGDIKEPSRNSSPGITSAPERCFFEQFWAEVIQEKERHFIEGKNAYSFTTGEGGFCNRRYTIELEDGRVLENMGVWHRGEVPECIRHLLVKGVRK